MCQALGTRESWASWCWLSVGFIVSTGIYGAPIRCHFTELQWGAHKWTRGLSCHQAWESYTSTSGRIQAKTYVNIGKVPDWPQSQRASLCLGPYLSHSCWFKPSAWQLKTLHQCGWLGLWLMGGLIDRDGVSADLWGIGNIQMHGVWGVGILSRRICISERKNSESARKLQGAHYRKPQVIQFSWSRRLQEIIEHTFEMTQEPASTRPYRPDLEVWLFFGGKRMLLKTFFFF